MSRFIMKTLVFSVLAISTLTTGTANAYDSPEDGTYVANVSTKSGTYTVPVEVDGGEVTHVNWPNGGNMDVVGGDLTDGTADGMNRRGETVHIEMNDTSYDSDSDDGD
jgi:hypothetical protein